MHVVLAQAVACRVLEALGDTEALKNASAKLENMERRILSVIDTRTEGNSQKILNLNGHLRQNKYFGRRSKW
jgi:hypothetical protein